MAKCRLDGRRLADPDPGGDWSEVPDWPECGLRSVRQCGISGIADALNGVHVSEALFQAGQDGNVGWRRDFHSPHHAGSDADWAHHLTTWPKTARPRAASMAASIRACATPRPCHARAT